MHKYKKPRFNLMYKDEYIEEQRLSEKGFVEENIQGMQQSELTQ